MFRTAECHLCKKVGHIAKACKLKQKNIKGQQSNSKTHHYVEEDEETLTSVEHSGDSETSYGMFTIEGSSSNPIVVQIDIIQVPCEMEVDTDASLSLINKATCDRICSRSHTQALQKTDVYLKTYTGEVLCILGTAKMLVTYGECVVDGRGPNLMGRDWLGGLNLTVGVINSLLTPAGLQEILDKHVTVFSNKLDTLKGVKVKLQTQPDVAPQIFKACTIPLALREKVKAELEGLESLGIIIPVQYSEWAAPVVPVLKHDGTMRLCDDYRVTINKAAKVDAYPLLRVEDLFAALSGGKCFSKLDMSRAYLQVPLDDNSRELVTINTQGFISIH